MMSNKLSQTKGVIFDIDGVLIDSYCAHLQSWQQVAQRYGREMTEKDFARTFGRTSREIIRQLWNEIGLNDEEIEVFDQEKEAAFRRIVEQEYPWMEGAEHLIATLFKAHFQLAVGSSGPKENVLLMLSRLTQREWITSAVSGSDVTYGKPHPEVFETAAKKIGVPPELCAVIEDAAAGISAANTAGMVSIGLISTGHEREEYKEADHVITALSDLSPAVIANWIDNAQSS
jgi:beta-phosphoglucomutase